MAAEDSNLQSPEGDFVEPTTVLISQSPGYMYGKFLGVFQGIGGDYRPGGMTNLGKDEMESFWLAYKLAQIDPARHVGLRLAKKLSDKLGEKTMAQKILVVSSAPWEVPQSISKAHPELADPWVSMAMCQHSHADYTADSRSSAHHIRFQWVVMTRPEDRNVLEGEFLRDPLLIEDAYTAMYGHVKNKLIRVQATEIAFVDLHRNPDKALIENIYKSFEVAGFESLPEPIGEIVI